MVLQIAIKLCESLKQNMSQHPNYLLYYPEISKLEIKGTWHET